MKRETTMLTAFAVVAAFALPSWAQVKQFPTETITIAGTIESIDYNRRAMQVKTADGKMVAVNVPESVQRFSEFKVGNNLQATYNNNVLVRLKPPGEPPVDTIDEAYQGADQRHEGDGAENDGEHRRPRQGRVVGHF